ncbi:hypothetical protein Pmar_PMAR009489 [Perkinsus marinus ATCC 50983]|uniref:Uncharacterized protein n=2 Tax=Perkinsus marinus (strain ATCC 50983 / TXsc) TaxID=423536 RepID=C5KNM5_PERM5|nr:hypothetical protein Pmar_PMAR009489 [Perkinsus marinus ATCC 50983]EER13918.1 hypothetical protein Pmar_PMAR009489 [Perkinsus marinus ATCC 50983]|eukprot:XP_002782123.1 hypothetical protein Pmar_PMAR009489 [Perkinsus marinus ATCC 50983]
MRQYSLVFLLLALSGLLDAQPSGKYCGSGSTIFGDFAVEIVITSSTTADIYAVYTPPGGDAGGGNVKDVKYTYDSSNGDITVTDVDKLDALIEKIGAPISGADLAHLKYTDGKILVVNLGNFALNPC